MAATSGSPTRLIRLPKVIQRTGYSRSSIYAKIALGEFPVLRMFDFLQQRQFCYSEAYA
jgi:predicted DNA-binding transcriptional regulator AlpA